MRLKRSDIAAFQLSTLPVCLALFECPLPSHESALLEFRFVVESSNSRTVALGQKRMHANDRYLAIDMVA